MLPLVDLQLAEMLEPHVRTTVGHSYNKDEIECLVDGIFLLFAVGLKLGMSDDDNNIIKLNWERHCPGVIVTH